MTQKHHLGMGLIGFTAILFHVQKSPLTVKNSSQIKTQSSQGGADEAVRCHIFRTCLQWEVCSAICISSTSPGTFTCIKRKSTSPSKCARDSPECQHEFVVSALESQQLYNEERLISFSLILCWCIITTWELKSQLRIVLYYVSKPVYLAGFYLQSDAPSITKSHLASWKYALSSCD